MAPFNTLHRFFKIYCYLAKYPLFSYLRHRKSFWVGLNRSREMNVTDAGNTLVFSETTPEEKKRLIAAMEQPPDNPRMITRKQVAALLGVHVETVKRYSRNKLLHPVKFTARAVRYSEAEVLDFMKNGGRL
jgi:predicted DNA-binding transcriptional regulator AlpA